MNKYFFLLLSSVIFFSVSCVETDSNLIGDWKLTKTHYLITANQDFTLYDLYGSPWNGKFIVNGNNIDVSSVIFYSDNTSGQSYLISDKTSISFKGKELIITFEEVEYLLQKEYNFDVESGIFKIEDIAKSNNGETIQVDIDLVIPHKELKQGDNVSVNVGLRNFQFINFKFYDGGRL